MQQKAQAILLADWGSGRTDTYKVQYNPKELSFEKSAQYGDINIPGLDSPLQQFVRGGLGKLTIELFFDTTEDGMGVGATSVTGHTDRVLRLVKVDGPSHAPAVVTFCWNNQFPGSVIAMPPSPKAESGAEGGNKSGNQSQNSFVGIAESVSQRFTLFSPEGVPLRATVTLVLREFRPLDKQLKELGLSSPDRTHAHVLSTGDTLSGVSADYYGQPYSWREIATENGIEDPRRLPVGRLVSVPAIT